MAGNVPAWLGWEENFDGRINPGATFCFLFPARRSHEAKGLVDKLVAGHFMSDLVEVTHATRTKRIS